MSILKMIPGQKIAFTVERVEQVEGKFGPQYAFRGETPDDTDAVMYLNVDAAERQLSRIGLTHSSVVGQTVEFERTEKNGTKYTNINPLHAYRAANPVPPAKPAAPAKQPYSAGGPLPYENQETGAPPSAMPRAARDEPTKLDGVLSLHDVCVMHSAKRTKELLMQQGLIPTAADILAAAATQMIAAQKVGATP